MSSVTSPNLKKQFRLDHDHRVDAENPHAFRKNWPKKKARGKRSLRRVQKLVADTAIADTLDDVGSDVRSARVGSPLWKSGVTSLRAAIDRKRAKRVRSVGRRAGRRESDG